VRQTTHGKPPNFIGGGEIGAFFRKKIFVESFLNIENILYWWLENEI